MFRVGMFRDPLTLIVLVVTWYIGREWFWITYYHFFANQ